MGILENMENKTSKSETKTELLLKRTSLSLYALLQKIDAESKTVVDGKFKKTLSEIHSEIKSIDNKMLKDFKIKFSDKTKSEISKFL